MLSKVLSVSVLLSFLAVGCKPKSCEERFQEYVEAKGDDQNDFPLPTPDGGIIILRGDSKGVSEGLSFMTEEFRQDVELSEDFEVVDEGLCKVESGQEFKYEYIEKK